MARQKNIFEKTKTALEKKGIITGDIKYIGKWRAVYGKDSNNISAVIPAILDYISVDVFLIYWPDSKIISASLWEPGRGGGSELYRLHDYSYTDHADIYTILEIAKDIKELLEEYNENYHDAMNYE